jgi:parallel beta-helix repeat protein
MVGAAGAIVADAVPPSTFDAAGEYPLHGLSTEKEHAMVKKVAASAAIIAVALAAAVLVGAAPAAAKALVVDPGESIQAAVDAAKPGDTVVVQPGTYHEAVCVTTDGVKLSGSGSVIVPPAQAPQTPCASGPEGQLIGIALFGQVNQQTGEVIDPLSDVTVSGFRVEGFAAFGIGMVGGEDVDIVDNTAVDNEQRGIARFRSTGGTMKANRATGSQEAGLYLDDSPHANASIVGNTAWDNGRFGILIIDSAQGWVVGNRSFGNCGGIFVHSTSADIPAERWTVKDNRVRDNTKACPPDAEGPPISGLGILLHGASRSTVLGNVVTGNRPTGPSFISGGIAVASSASRGGYDPVGNLVKGNRLGDNQPDLFYDGTGSGNVFVDNSCETSIPDGLC